MKRIGIFGLLLAVMLAVGVSATTTTEITWDGAGNVGVDFIAGDDAENYFETSGSAISGNYYAEDRDNNPYNYGVDNVKAEVKANVGNGYIEYQYNRLDSKASYGSAGQTSYSYLGSDGTASLAWRTTSNYAAMKSSNYGFQSSNQFSATGNHILHHTLATPNSEAKWTIFADGTSTVSHMSDEAQGDRFKFGKGCGCFTNAKVDVTGSGTYELEAIADNEIKTDTGITTDGYLQVYADFANGFKFDNFALQGE